jgi:hypothetical protein
MRSFFKSQADFKGRPSYTYLTIDLLADMK